METENKQITEFISDSGDSKKIKRGAMTERNVVDVFPFSWAVGFSFFREMTVRTLGVVLYGFDDIDKGKSFFHVLPCFMSY